MSKILAVGSPKGGVGKTTTAVTLAVIAASLLKLRVLLVDADANRSALDWTARAEDVHTPFDVVSGTNVDELAQLRRSRKHDLTVVDLPGAREGAFATVLRGAGGRPVADFLLVPSKAALMDLLPISRVIRDEVHPLRLPYLVVFTQVYTRSVARAHDQAANLRSERDIAVADTAIRRYDAYDDARNLHRTVVDLRGRHSIARAAERDYLVLAAEVFPQLDLDVTAITARIKELDTITAK